MIHKIHRTPQDEQMMLSQSQLSQSQKNIIKLDELKSSIDKLDDTLKDKTTEIIGFSGVIQKIEDSVEAIDALKKDINNSEKVVRKLEELKSAGLITNKVLKDISKKEIPQPKEFPKEISVSLKGISVVTIKGDKGEKGDSIKGDKGDSIKGDKGDPIVGPRGIKGERGEDGRNGKDGQSITGPKGADGVDGSPDTGDEIISKINSSKTIIDAERVRGLVQLIRSMEDSIANYPLGGGGNRTGDITVETPPETPDSVITVFTVSKTPKWVVADGIQYFSGNGYTANAGSVTMTVPPSQYIRVMI